MSGVRRRPLFGHLADGSSSGVRGFLPALLRSDELSIPGVNSSLAAAG
jgi:hypothetical protein